MFVECEMHPLIFHICVSLKVSGYILSYDCDVLTIISVFTTAMSFSTGAVAHSCCSTYGTGSGSVHISSVSCQGTEPSITSCQYSLNGANHLNDVAVTCQQGGEESVELYINRLKKPYI